jgi:hypothetical protein
MQSAKGYVLGMVVGGGAPGQKDVLHLLIPDFTFVLNMVLKRLDTSVLQWIAINGLPKRTISAQRMVEVQFVKKLVVPKRALQVVFVLRMEVVENACILIVTHELNLKAFAINMGADHDVRLALSERNITRNFVRIVARSNRRKLLGPLVFHPRILAIKWRTKWRTK